MVTPAARREALDILKAKGLSERAACRIAGVSRRIASYELRQPAKDKELEALNRPGFELPPKSWTVKFYR